MRPSSFVHQRRHLAWVLVLTVVVEACGAPAGPQPLACSEPTASAPIADAALATAVRDALGASAPTCAELATLTALNLRDLSVASLAGLEHAHGLVILEADRNEIDDVSPLASLAERGDCRDQVHGGGGA